MKHRKRKLSGKRIKKQRMMICFSIALICMFSVGYAAFNTIININVSGTAKGTTVLITKILNLKQNGDTSLIDDGTDDHNIRYSGKNVNNYVCLENENPCSDDNLYRIIGVFNNIKSFENGNGETRVKLIKANNIGKIQLDESGSNNWARPATLNTLLNSSSIAYSNLIDNAIWFLGHGAAYDYASKYYIFERSNNTNLNNEAPTTWIGKIALMYPSDYGFASSECYSIYNLVAYEQDICKNSNWLYSGYYEWLISPNEYNSNRNYNIYNNGQTNTNTPVIALDRTVRPSFYLKSSVKVLENGNDGSSSKPYVLTV